MVLPPGVRGAYAGPGFPEHTHPAPGQSIEVTSAKSGRDAGRLKVEVVEHDGGVTICAVYPTPKDSDKPNELKPGQGGRMNSRIRSDFPLTIRGEISKRKPNATLGDGGPTLALRAVNGGIDIERK